MRNILDWIRENAFGIVLSVSGLLVVYSQITTAVSVAEQMEELKVQAENAQTALALSSGKAVYMAGASCTIKTTPDITVEQLKVLSKACVRAHEQYLEESKDHRQPQQQETEVENGN